MLLDGPGDFLIDIRGDQLRAPVAVVGRQQPGDGDVVQQAGHDDLLAEPVRQGRPPGGTRGASWGSTRAVGFISVDSDARELPSSARCSRSGTGEHSMRRTALLATLRRPSWIRTGQARHAGELCREDGWQRWPEMRDHAAMRNRARRGGAGSLEMTEPGSTPAEPGITPSPATDRDRFQEVQLVGVRVELPSNTPRRFVLLKEGSTGNPVPAHPDRRCRGDSDRVRAAAYGLAPSAYARSFP